MPTGYTAPVEDGTITTLRDYALRCARGMGACIMQRDEYLDVPPRVEQSEGDYHATQLAELKASRAAIESLTDEEATAKCDVEHANAVSRSEESAKKNAVEIGRYAAMKAKVVSWTPPTPEHVGLKTFMLEQLETGKPYDMTEYNKVPAKVTGAEWKAAKLASIDEDIAYHVAKAAEEATRVAGRSAWIKALYDGLPTK